MVEMGEAKLRYQKIRVVKTDYQATRLCWNNKMPIFAASYDTGLLQIYTVLSERPIMEVQAHEKKITDLEWSATGLFLATCSEDGFIKIWSITSNTCITQIKENAKILSISWAQSDDSSLMYITDQGVLIIMIYRIQRQKSS